MQAPFYSNTHIKLLLYPRAPSANRSLHLALKITCEPQIQIAVLEFGASARAQEKKEDCTHVLRLKESH